MSNYITIAEAAKELGIVPKNVRRHLANAANAGQPICGKHGTIWLLARADMPKLRAWIASQRAKVGFQPGNTHAQAKAGKGLKKGGKKTSRKSPA